MKLALLKLPISVVTIPNSMAYIVYTLTEASPQNQVRISVSVLLNISVETS